MVNLSISALNAAYQSGELTPELVMQGIRERAKQFAAHNIWIHLLTEEETAPYLSALKLKSPDTHPLWGIPFAIKDNIDLAGIPTTAACEEFTYFPEQSATVVENLIGAGAIPVGKTNLDQFATGLNGTRSPYGVCKNAFDPDYISGGSSAGSAVAVALGLASFSLGTDTAGSGRVPACFNNLIGLKPSRGLLSNNGVVRACRSLDCVNIFSLNTDDANLAMAAAEGQDESDEYSRKNPYANLQRHYGSIEKTLKVGVLPESQLEFFGDKNYESAYYETIDNLAAIDLNIQFVEIDYEPFLAAAKLLYEGPWVSERYLGTLPLSKENPEAMLDVIRAIIEPGKDLLAIDAFAAQYKLMSLKNQCLSQLKALDCLLAPTTSKHFTIDEMLADPIAANSKLGQYTNFVNLLDLSAVAMPTTFTQKGLPFGVTLIADHFKDRKLLSIANTILQQLSLPMGATGIALPPTTSSTAVKNSDRIDLVVCGAHMEGLPLNWQLTERGARLVDKTTTQPSYRLYALAGDFAGRPGLIYDETEGAKIEVEVWSIAAAEFGSFVAEVPSPLGIGKIRLINGDLCSGFICEPFALSDAEEITQLGGWRKYLTQET
ncbi:MAG: allophanate hydrolase [Thiotrichales bacterium]